MRQPVSSLVRVALALVAVLALGVACEGATAPQLTAGAVRMTPPARFAVWWRLTQACSGLTGDYAAVQWYVVPNTTTIDDAGKTVDAYWISNPDRIVLSDAHRDDGMTVRHEMLHVLLHRDGHPRSAYLVGCGGVVACDGECAIETGGYTSPTAASPELQPGDVAPRVDVIPPLPTEVSDTGAVAVMLTITNPRSEPVWVRLTPRESGDLQFPTFGVVADYDDPARPAAVATYWSQSDRLPLGAGESKHWVWESALRRGRYGVLSYFNVDTLPRQGIAIGPQSPDARRDASSARSARGLPAPVRLAHAHAARPISGGDRRGFVGEEHTVLRVATRERAPCARAVEAAVDLQATVPAEQARRVALDRLATRVEEMVLHDLKLQATGLKCVGSLGAEFKNGGWNADEAD